MSVEVDAAPTWEQALRAIAAGEHVCEKCGVEYGSGYAGQCQEPMPYAQWLEGPQRWSAMCPGEVTAAGTARRALGVNP